MNTEYLIEDIKDHQYNSGKYKSTCNSDLASFIRNNLDQIKMNDVMLINVYKKIIKPVHMFKDILEYEFLNYSPDIKIHNIDDLVKCAVDELKKYQGIIGGYDIEDSEWIYKDGSVNKTTCRFKITENQKIIYNTIEKSNEDNKNILFIKHFVKYMERFIENEVRLSITFKVINDDQNNITWIIIVFTKLIDFLE